MRGRAHSVGGARKLEVQKGGFTVITRRTSSFATVYQLQNIMATLSFVKFITSTIVLVAAVVAWSCDEDTDRSG